MNKGRCVCGEVTYEISEPITSLYQCHCTMCQQQTGSASQTGAFVNTDKFRWCSGEASITTFRKPTGYIYSFCRCCGATVPNMFRSGDLYWVPAGATVGLTGAEIKNHIFVANKADWDTIGGDGVQHEGFYPVYDEL